MSFIKRIFRRSVPSQGPAYIDPAGFFASVRSQMARTTDPLAHATLHTCIRLISQTAASIPWKVMSGNDDESEEIVDSADAWYRLFSKPNPTMTRRDLKELTITQLLLTGESLWVCTDADGNPVAEDEVPVLLWPKGGNEVEEATKDGRLIGWKFKDLLGQSNAVVPLHAVVQMTDLRDPAKPWRGISRLRAAQLTLENDLLQQAWSKAFYENGASPGGQIVSPEGVSLTPEQSETAAKQWNAKHKGVEKAGKTAVLPWGLKWMEVPSPTHREQGYTETLLLDRDTIAALYGVPQFFFSAGDAAFNSSRNQRRALIETTVLPLCAKIEDAIEQSLIEPRTDPKVLARKEFVWVEFDPHTGPTAGVMQDDLDAKAATGTKLRDLGYTQTEINARLDLGMPEVDDPIADARFLPSGLQLAEKVLDPTEPQEFGLPPPPGTPPAPGTPPPPPTDPTAEPTNNPDAGKDGKQEPVARSLDDGAVRRTAYWQSFERGLASHEKSFRSKLSRYLNERRSEVLAIVGGQKVSRSAGSFDEQIAQARSRWDEELRKLMEPVYRAAAIAGVESIGNDLGTLKVISAQDPRVLRFAADKALKVTGINGTLIDSLKQTIVDGLAANETTEQLQARIRSNFGTSRSKALTVARTEAASASSGARQLAMEAEGVEETEWISSRSPNARAAHAAIDGKRVKLGASFIDGIMLRFPGDPDAPADAVCNCGCTTAPVVT